MSVNDEATLKLHKCFKNFWYKNINLTYLAKPNIYRPN